MSLNILIVDDSSTIRAMIRRIVQMTGVAATEILQAGNGQEALDTMKSKPVDLVLADVNMPVMDGAEMTRRVLADDSLKKIPVVIVSSDPNTDRIDELLRAGAKGYLPKPFTPEAFRKTITAITGAAQ